MEVVILKNQEEATDLAARVVADLVKRKPDAVFGLATGKTPEGIYKKIVSMHKSQNLDFSKATGFNLDEYVGLSEKHPSSYRHYMKTKLFDHVPFGKYHVPKGDADNIVLECESYEAQIKSAGGIDLQILGVGSEGHIGFNEPSSSLSSRTRLKTLTDKTRSDNAADFGSKDDVPKHVITMGIGTIMESRQIMLVAFGDKKANVVAKLIEGPITSMVPASILQMHQKATVILDEASAKKLQKLDYYKWVYQNKPDWQSL